MIKELILAIGLTAPVEQPIDPYKWFRGYRQGIQYQCVDIFFKDIPYHVHYFDKDRDGKLDVAELRKWGFKGFEEIPTYLYLDFNHDHKFTADELVEWEDYRQEGI